jgi:branched-chain amino acid transport system permease protein
MTLAPRLLPGRAAKLAAFAILAAYCMLPFFTSEFWLSVLDYAGIAAIGAIGLNLLTGFAGQISLGHAAFLGAGAYTAAWVGDDVGLALPVWLAAAALAGGLLGALIGPAALRLRGNYLAIVTLGLVFAAEHVYRNWAGLTGGNAGRAIEPPTALLVDFDSLDLLGYGASRNQGWFWLIWALVALATLLVANLARGRQGRALKAVRDRDLAAELSGVPIARTKVAAFALSSALAAVGGALLGAYQAFVSPGDWSLVLSIQYVAIVIAGGLGTIYGPLLGALFVGSMPRVIEEYSDAIPGVASGSRGDGFITVFALNQVLFGLLIIGFLMLEPRGLAALGRRVGIRIKRLAASPRARTEGI